MMAMPPVADFASGLQSALTIAAALLGRQTSGRGARLDLSLAETVLGWQSMNLTLAARGLIDNPAAGLPRREVRFPAWIDGAPSTPRIAARRITLAQAAALWR